MRRDPRPSATTPTRPTRPVGVVTPTPTPTPTSTAPSAPSSPPVTPAPTEPTTPPRGVSIVPSGSGLGWEGFGGGVLPGANWRPYAPSSPFNQSTEGVPVAANSAAIVNAVLAN
ncbi:MAG TPA: hypothetical protein VN889_07005, partial [Solirubrobacteraceae bacterium]|nr:hypothetical protein [Solirubrobacteraceae bacterium]